MTLVRFDPLDNAKHIKEVLDPLKTWHKKVGYMCFRELCSEQQIETGLTLGKSMMQDTEFVILDGSMDDFSKRFAERRLEIFRREGINAIVISGCAEHLIDPQNGIFYYPYWWPRTRKHFADPGVSIFAPRKYIFASLNGKSRLHRVILADHMRTKNYLDRCCLSFNDISIPSRVSLWQEQERWWIDTEFQDLRSKDLLLRARDWLPWYNKKIDYYSEDQWQDVAACYQDSYVNIVTESSINDIFLSEKTFKALGSGQFFISVNAPGSVEVLKLLGFDTFDDIIDHSYDKIADPFDKIACISTMLDQLATADWQNLWDKTRARRLKNKEIFYSGDFKKAWLSLHKFVQDQVHAE